MAFNCQFKLSIIFEKTYTFRDSINNLKDILCDLFSPNVNVSKLLFKADFYKK